MNSEEKTLSLLEELTVQQRLILDRLHVLDQGQQAINEHTSMMERRLAAVENRQLELKNSLSELYRILDRFDTGQEFFIKKELRALKK